METRHIVTCRAGTATSIEAGEDETISQADARAVAMRLATEDHGGTFDVWAWVGSAVVPNKPVWSEPKKDTDTD